VLSWFSDDLLDYLLIVLSVILLLVGLSHFVHTYRLYERAEARYLTIKPLWWFKKITGAIWLLIVALWMALCWYKNRLRKKLETIEHAIQMRKIVYTLWWSTVCTLVLVAVSVFTICHNGSDKSVFDLILLLFIVFFLVYTLVTSWTEWRFYSERPLCNIAAAGLLEKHTKFLNERDLDKAYNALVKACETAPDGTYLWCKLAFFCEEFRKNAEETNRFMAKASESITAKKSKSSSDRACYFQYLGLINCLRGELQKGLEYLKQAIDIEPEPKLIKLYEQLLSESHDKQSSKPAE
jgi:tetratricopeptide (TPR) repeat protein